MSALFAALLDDTVGRWFLYFGALVFFGVLAVLAFLSVRKHISKAVAELGIIRHEVKNDHTTNLRVEADERHEENAGQLRLIASAVEGLTSSVGSLQRGQSALYELVRGNTDKIADIEDTLDGRPEITIEPETEQR